jgi:thiamine pyrophosphokinase
MSNCLIICNGKLSKKLLAKFVKLNTPRKRITIISCDGASDFLKRNNLTPDYITGDLDSVSQKTLSHFKQKKVKIKKVYDQDFTDFEKALRLAVSKKFKNIFVAGFSGKRLDHTLSNLSILKRYCRKAKIKVYDDTFVMICIYKSIEFNYKKGQVVSLLALPAARGIKTKGLKWELENESLELGVREGVSNTANDNRVKISFRSGTLLVFKKHFGSISL